ncbi:MFS transporter [Clostridium folliculivorans]|uniref:Symporter YnaJ n=1 Tax=Clostridium folliculivorans TaxID=2886038 RepID=A0A9W6DBI9_9CLOT|nr:MFS transporter [Clostridium folliculivorans]GKU26475.1 putative symporter YnaJ [Clostridium folliculivorans]GKU29093.1 putative symporter YnaJ [Clostridium folliculivorans]
MEGLDKNIAVNETSKISFVEKLAFGGGGFAGNIMIQSINMYLMFFYTDVFKINAMVAGTLFLVARLVDAVCDFTIGYLMDHTKTKWGKFRPFVMFGFIPFCILGVACFVVPGFSDSGKVVYAYVTYIGFMIATTVATLPGQAILPAITQEPMERVKLNNYAQFLGMTGMMIVAVGMMPFVQMLGGKSMAKGFILTMSIFAVIAAALYLFWISKVRERVVVKKVEEIKLKDALPIIFQNKYLLLLVGAFVFFMSGFTIRNNVQMYYLIYAVRRPDLIPTVGLLSMLPLIATILLVPVIVGKIGKKNALILGMSIVVISNVIQYFVGYNNLTAILVLTAVFGIGSGLFVPLVWGILPDTVDYAHWKFGKRTEGIITSTFVFTQKASSGIAGYIAGAALVAVGYMPNAAQSPATLNGISFLYNIGGAVFAVIAIIFMLFYDLDSKKYNEIVEDLHKRDAEN